MATIRCEELIQKELIESYAEFEFVLACGMSLGMKGHVLDISGCRITDPSILSPSDKTYLSYLRSVGFIYNGVEPEVKFDRGSVEDRWADKSPLYFDVSLFHSVGDKLVQDRGEDYYWSLAWTDSSYGSYRKDIISYKNMDVMFSHLIAEVFVSVYLGERQRKPLTVEFNNQESRTVFVYVNLIIAMQTMPVLDSFLNLQRDVVDGEIDIDLSILYRKAVNAGRYQRWGVHKKMQVMKEAGLTEGSVAVLFERRRVNPSSPIGKIMGASLIVINEFKEDENFPSLTVSNYVLNKTKEEQIVDYFSISEEKRHHYDDMLDFRVYAKRETIQLYDYGVVDHFFDEGYLIEPLDVSEKVTKLVTIRGKSTPVEMSGVDAIYWLLCQYGVDFDQELFRDMYNGGAELMWDKFGEQPSLPESL